MNEENDNLTWSGGWRVGDNSNHKWYIEKPCTDIKYNNFNYIYF